MRSLKELYGLLIEEVEKGDTWGICEAIGDMHRNKIIDWKEYMSLDKHFELIPRPTIFSHPHLEEYLCPPESLFYFKVKSVPPRIAFLKEIQNSLPNN